MYSAKNKSCVRIANVLELFYREKILFMTFLSEEHILVVVAT